MKWIEEFRDPEIARQLIERIHERTRRPWVLMEICGGQTHAILQHGLDQLLPEEIELVHGPGCPVCVTPMELLDHAIALAGRDEVILTTFGDMLRVPGSRKDLFTARAEGGDVRMVYSPLDALNLARTNPGKQVVFFAVGFETTAPATALSVLQAQREGVSNFSLLTAHVRVPPALEVLLAAPENRVQGVLAAGHVCTVMGWEEYRPISERYRIPIVITGFEPVDILRGVEEVVALLENARVAVVNRYERVVQRHGNPQAKATIDRVYEPTDLIWRGMGLIPNGGLRLRQEFSQFDAVKKFSLTAEPEQPQNGCLSGLVLQGRIKPPDCPAFGVSCTPANPLGAPMVSAEGACAAYYRYQAQTG